MDDEKINVAELIDDMIVNCNTGIRNLVTGNYIAWCNVNVQTIQKLSLLKEQYTAEINDMTGKIETLKTMLQEKDGAE